MAIQYHLYEHPLYMCCSDSDDELNVLIVGFDKYGHYLLDACLQNGQIRNKKLNVKVILNDENEKVAYFLERPELSNFFDVDGSLSEDDDNYGRISFQCCRDERLDHKENTDNLQTIICKSINLNKAHYVFIALGDDALNMAAAISCRDKIENLGINCVVSYICEGYIESYEQTSLFPICISADIQQHHLFHEIERMAFNTHLVWEKNLNIDYGSVRAGFRKDYNHNSCVSNVLSIKYKLHSVGIELESVGFTEAAKIFERILSEPV